MTAQAFRPGNDTHNELALKLKGRPNLGLVATRRHVVICIART